MLLVALLTAGCVNDEIYELVSFFPDKTQLVLSN